MLGSALEVSYIPDHVCIFSSLEIGRAGCSVSHIKAGFGRCEGGSFEFYSGYEIYKKTTELPATISCVLSVIFPS